MPSSPASPGSATKRASPEKIDSSALTTSTWMVWVESTMASGLELLGLLAGLVDRADHVEGLFGPGVAFTGHDHLEAADGFRERHVLARRAREHFGHVE